MNLLNKLAFWFVVVIVALLPLISWEGFFFGSTFAKAIFFTICVELVFILWLSSASCWKIRLIEWAVIGFFAAFVFSAFLGMDVVQSIWSNYERMTGLWTFSHVVIFFFICSRLLHGEKRKTQFLAAIVAGGAIVALVGIMEFFKGPSSIRIQSTLNNAAFLGSYLLIIFFINLFLLLREKRLYGMALVWLASLPIVSIALLFTGSRASMLGVIFGLLVTAILFIVYKPREVTVLSMSYKTLNKIAVIFLIGLVVAISALFVFRERLEESSFGFIKRIGRISFSDVSASGRLLTWHVAWEGWQVRPLLGWGPENFPILFSANYDPRLVDFEPWFDRAHNLIFDFGSTIGIVGLLLYLLIFIASFLALSRVQDIWTRIVFTALLAAYIVEHLFVFDSITSLVILFAVLAFINSYTATKSFTARSRPIFILFGLFSITPLLFIGMWKPLQENRLGRAGYETLARGRDEDAIALFERALAYDTYGNIDVRRAVAEYWFECAKIWNECGGKRDTDARRRVILYALEKMEQNIQEKPLDVKWYMYQGQLYRMASTLSEPPDMMYASLAEKRFSEARKMSPGRPQNYLEIALARKLQKNYNGMWNILEEAEHLAPDYRVIEYNMFSHAVDLGDRAREQQALGRIFADRGAPQYELLRDAYARNKRFNDAVRAQEKLIEARLSNSTKLELATLYQTLAALYKLSGDMPRAREAALKVGELNPALQKEVDAFLGTLK